MKETKKMWIILGVALAIIILIVAIVANKGGTDKNVLDDFYELLNSRKYEMLYIGKSDCGYCAMFDNNLTEISEIEKFDYLKIEIDKVLASTANEIIERLELDEVSTPYIAIVKDGEVIENFGYLEPNELLNKLKSYDFVSMDTELGLNYLTLESYFSLFDSGKRSVVALSSTDNELNKTKTFKKILKEIASENKIEINYFELLFTTEEEYKSFVQTFGIVETEGIPLFAIIENQKVVDYTSGTISKDELLTLLKENKVIK